jgi:hypothetical protein
MILHANHTNVRPAAIGSISTPIAEYIFGMNSDRFLITPEKRSHDQQLENISNRPVRFTGENDLYTEKPTVAAAVTKSPTTAGCIAVAANGV